MGTTQATVDLHDLRFYVSGVSLINDKGEAVAVTLDVNDWQTKEVTLIDLEDGTGACADAGTDRKSTRLNSSHLVISYAVFCLKKKKKNQQRDGAAHQHRIDLGLGHAAYSACRTRPSVVGHGRSPTPAVRTPADVHTHTLESV